MGHNNSIDSIDLSNGEFLYSIGKVQLSIGLLHLISQTQKNIAVVEGPHKRLSIPSIQSICQMENFYIRLEKSSFPLDCCISLARHRKISPQQQGPINLCRFDRLVKLRILMLDRKSAASHWDRCISLARHTKISPQQQGSMNFCDSIDSVDLSNGAGLVFDIRTKNNLYICIESQFLLSLALLSKPWLRSILPQGSIE